MVYRNLLHMTPRMARVRVTKDRLYSEEREEEHQESMMLKQLKSTEKNKGYVAEKNGKQPEAPTLAPYGEGKQKLQPQDKPGNPGDKRLAVPAAGKTVLKSLKPSVSIWCDSDSCVAGQH
jgi:hypothetical protein